MEGGISYSLCTATTCSKKERGWVPFPVLRAPKKSRSALADAWALTENPCCPPGRCPPCCRPIPKFRLYRQLGTCDKETLALIAKEKKKKEREEAREQWRQYYESQMEDQIPPPCVDVIVLDQQLNRPIHIERDCPPSGRWKEMKPKTDYMAGFFNTDDNKTYEELMREKCDPSYVCCQGQCDKADGMGLIQYPCRGVINYPCLKWVTVDEENRKSFPAFCAMGKNPYISPENLAELERQKEIWAQEDRRKELERIAAEASVVDPLDPYGCYKDPYCQSNRCSETEYCLMQNQPRRL